MTFKEWWDSEDKFDADTVGKGGIRACCEKAWLAAYRVGEDRGRELEREAASVRVVLMQGETPRTDTFGSAMVGPGEPELVDQWAEFARGLERELGATADALKSANDICRSAYQIAHRISTDHGAVALGVNFDAFKWRCKESLAIQHRVMYPEQYTEDRLVRAHDSDTPSNGLIPEARNEVAMGDGLAMNRDNAPVVSRPDEHAAFEAWIERATDIPNGGVGHARHGWEAALAWQDGEQQQRERAGSAPKMEYPDIRDAIAIIDELIDVQPSQGNDYENGRVSGLYTVRHVLEDAVKRVESPPKEREHG